MAQQVSLNLEQLVGGFESVMFVIISELKRLLLTRWGFMQKNQDSLKVRNQMMTNELTIELAVGIIGS